MAAGPGQGREARILHARGWDGEGAVYWTPSPRVSHSLARGEGGMRAGGQARGQACGGAAFAAVGGYEQQAA